MHSIRLLSAATVLLLVLAVALGILPPVRASPTTIAVEPQTVNVIVGSDFSVDIWIRNVGSMLSFHFKVTWNPNLMGYVSRTLLLQPGWAVTTETIDASGGTYALAAAGGMFSGDASWVTLGFHCLGVGSSSIGISDSGWENPSVFTPFDVVSGGTSNQIAPVGPVGGIIAPANKLEIIAPYLALAGLVAVVSAVLVGRRQSERDSPLKS